MPNPQVCRCSAWLPTANFSDEYPLPHLGHETCQCDQLLDEQLGILGWSGEQLEHLACSSEQLPHCSSELLPHLAQPLPDARAGASYQACTLATGDVVPASCLLVDELTDDVLAQVCFVRTTAPPLQVALPLPASSLPKPYSQSPKH